MRGAETVKGRARWLMTGTGAGLLVLVGAAVTQGSAAAVADYRVAVASIGDVTQTLSATGSIASASRYDLSFQHAGTVDAVEVAIGDTVSAGQVLATLDLDALQNTVTAAQETLTIAQEQLDSDLDAQSSGTSSSSGLSVSGSSQPSTSTAGTAGSGTGASAQEQAARGDLTAAQQALLVQYDLAVAALDAFTQAATGAQVTCAAFTTASQAGDDAVGSGDEQDTQAVPNVQDLLAECQAATQAALDAQTESGTAQAALIEASSRLDGAVSALLEAQGGTSDNEAGVVGGSVPGIGGSTASFGGSSTGNLSPSSAVPNAEDILADKAQITAAEAALAVAQSQLEYATLATPVAGTVVAMGVASGDTVSAGDGSAVITVVADRTYVVDISVSLAHARLLETGQPVVLTLVSTGDTVDGAVSRVSKVNSGNVFQASYAVTIAVPDPGFEIRIGAATRMEITVAQEEGVLVVPTSAIVNATGQATVRVLDGQGVPQAVAVTVGAVGGEYTAVISGLSEGQGVVLADLTAPLDEGDADLTSGNGLLGGLGDSGDSDSGEQQFGPPGGFGDGGAGFPVRG